MVKEAFRRDSGVCLCPPRLPACVCGARKALEGPDPPADPAVGSRGRAQSAFAAAPACARPKRRSGGRQRSDADETPVSSTLYAQSKRVENLHLTRERDRRRGRELATFLLAGLPVACALLVYAALHIETVRVGYLREARQATMAELNEDNRRLRAELGRASSPDRVAALPPRRRASVRRTRARSSTSRRRRREAQRDERRPRAAARASSRWCSSCGRRSSSAVSCRSRSPRARATAPAPSASRNAASRSSGRRGSILDREGRELAVSVEASSVYAIPDDVERSAQRPRRRSRRSSA